MKLALVITALLLIMSGVYAYRTGVDRLMIEEPDPGKMLSRAAESIVLRPQTRGMSSIGNHKAPIILVAYLRQDAIAERFVTEYLPRLRTEYEEEVRVYVKPHTATLPADGAAQALACCSYLPEEEYIACLEWLYAEGEEPDIRECLEAGVHPALRQTAFEVNQLGMVGMSPHIYIGVEGLTSTIISGLPKYEDLDMEIRRAQTVVGE